ncbi:MAG: putative lipid II flippase FtsW [Acidimicrobiales bacterium]|nr:putative lipid II flippase FtsW [Acidimicrobiales bacterium]
MTAVERGPRKERKAASRGRHPASRVAPDGRGPRRPVGRRTGPFLIIFLATAALVLLGVVMTLSASAVVSINTSDSAWSLFRRQLMWTGFGTVALFAAMRFDYRRLRVLALPAAVGSAVLLVVVLIPGVGVDVNGATRWIRVGPLSFQPSEIAKLGLVLFAADILSRPSRDMKNTAVTFRPVVAVTAFFIGLLMLQPHLGNALIMAVAVCTMLFIAGAPLVNLAAVGLVGALGTAMTVIGTSWRRQRFRVFLDPWVDPEGLGYQPLQALHAITVGGLTGVGLGASKAKWGFLPFAHSDFIFAIIAEELGLLGAAFVVLAFVIFAGAGFVAALRAPDRFGLLLALGITTWIVAQAFLNIGSVINIVPVVGVTLPFLSFGGTSLVVTMAAVGVLLNVARQGR